MTSIEFRSLARAKESFALLDLIPDTHTWIKNREGRFVFGNRLFFERFGFKSMQALVGKCDYDLAPAYLADQYTSDDAAVLEGGGHGGVDPIAALPPHEPAPVRPLLGRAVYAGGF